MRHLSFIAVLSCLAGCASPPPTWFAGTRSGSGQAEFANDFLECQALSNRLVGYINDRTVYTCMQGKSWNMTKPKY